MTHQKPVFSAEAKGRIQEMLTRYPQPRGALIPTLWIAQEEFGWLSEEVMQLVAAELGLPEGWVFTTATFYTMLRKQPVGKYHLQICTNISCYLRGSDELMAVAQDMLGIGPGETTEDGLFTLESVQCLAACGFAPAMVVNKRDFFNVAPDELEALIDGIEASEAAAAEQGGAHG